MTRYTDDFNRADGVVGNKWVELSSTGIWVVSNNRLTVNATTSTVRYLRFAQPMSSPDHKVGQIMNRGQSGSQGLCIRSNEQMTRHYGIRTTTSTVQMFRINNGTTLIGPTGSAWPGGSFVEFGIKGQTLSYWLNGVLQWEFEDTVITDGASVGNRWQSASTIPAADDFYAEDPSKTNDWVNWYDGITEVPAMLQGVWDGSNVVKATFDRNS